MKVLHDEPNHQINYLDERFYTLDGQTFYPSVTTVLEAYPKGFGYIQWLKDLGSNAEEVVSRAAEVGSHVHDAIDRYLSGSKITWTDESGNAHYTLEEWMMILRFVDFWTTIKPELIAHEEQVVSETMKIGGTIDLVCKIGDKIFLIDYKTTNAIYQTHYLQVSAYAMMWNEAHPEAMIDGVGIMHLKARTRGANGKNIQGEGWQVKESEKSYEEDYSLFEHVRAIWDKENPNYKPKNMIYPDFVELKI